MLPLFSMILSFLFYVFIGYLLFKLVFDFILPVYRTTRKVKRGFREMHEKMQQNSQQYQKQSAPEQKPDKAVGEYIDFEEVKD
jgi:hypothetical protein